MIAQCTLLPCAAADQEEQETKLKMTEELREGLLDPANQMLVWIRLSRKHPLCWTRQLVLACWCYPRVFCFFLTRGNSCLHGRACCLPHWQKCLSCMLQLWCVFSARPQNSKHTFLIIFGLFPTTEKSWV